MRVLHGTCIDIHFVIKLGQPPNDISWFLVLTISYMLAICISLPSLGLLPIAEMQAQEALSQLRLSI